MFLLYFLIWILFNGRITWEIALFGIVIAGAVYWFTCKFMGYSFRKDIRLAKKAGTIVKLLVTLLIEIVKANLQVIGWVYNKRKEMEPEIVHFTADLKKPITQVALADCITLTPGTITGYQEGNRYVVHCLDKSMADGIDQSVFVDVLKELEEE
jgi:multicomponent Na+:H+ antiporter subunit E